MRAYRFLSRGAVNAANGFAWPAPRELGAGAWVGAPADATALGVAVYRAHDLPYWLDSELWEVETRGNSTLMPTRIFADEVRLVSRVPGWDDEVLHSFSAACVE